jgi:hypothetical protein
VKDGNMTAQRSYSILRRPLAALAVALAFAFGLSLAGGAAKPAAADASQWKISQPHWSDQSNAWRRHNQWRNQWNGNQWHHRRHFNNGFHGCFGNCGRPVIVFNGGGVVFASPGFVVVNPGFIVRQGHFIVGQPGFVSRRPNFIFERPAFAAKQKAFFKRHPSLQLGQPWKHKPWKRKPMSMGQGGVRIITPGMN